MQKVGKPAMLNCNLSTSKNIQNMKNTKNQHTTSQVSKQSYVIDSTNLLFNSKKFYPI